MRPHANATPRGSDPHGEPEVHASMQDSARTDPLPDRLVPAVHERTGAFGWWKRVSGPVAAYCLTG